MFANRNKSVDARFGRVFTGSHHSSGIMFWGPRLHSSLSSSLVDAPGKDLAAKVFLAAALSQWLWLPLGKSDVFYRVAILRFQRSVYV